MKKLLVLLMLVLGVVLTTAAQVTLEVYEADGETPFDCNDDIMVGTELTLIISSDSNDYWSGGLFIEGQDRALGTLAGRGLDPNDPNARDYTDSHCENAGDFAIATGWQDSLIWGFDLFTFYPVDGNSVDSNTVAGDWFIIDYQADEVGDCNVGFYDYSISWDDPNYFLTFSHSPTRDLNSDEKVNFIDFAVFASQWDANDCNDPNWCDGADLDRDGNVDYNDLGLFVEYWLWPSQPPKAPDYPEDANITYSIVDINDNNEITMDVNESITLYVKIVTTEANNVRMFDIEVNISDTNLASIDNTPVGSNDPLPTAQILAEPDRLEWADYWGPGIQQEEGIEFFGTTMESQISDGNLASFVFTCEGEGDVTLELINWSSFNTDDKLVFPKLEGIVIHQIEMMGDGMGEMQELQQSQSVHEIDIDEIVRWLEELWNQENNIRETYSEAKWNEFLDSIKNSY